MSVAVAAPIDILPSVPIFKELKLASVDVYVNEAILFIKKNNDVNAFIFIVDPDIKFIILLISKLFTFNPFVINFNPVFEISSCDILLIL